MLVNEVCGLKLFQGTMKIGFDVCLVPAHQRYEVS